MTEAAPISAIVDSIDDVHFDIRIIRVRADRPLTWIPGQYMNLAFHGFPERPYSIGSAPHSGLPEFHIRRAGIAGVSQHVAASVRAGDPLTLRGPFGDAGIIAGDDKKLVLIAGGMGLPPMKAMIDDALHHGMTRPTILYWGTRTIEEMYLADYFADLAAREAYFTFVPVIDDPVSKIIAEQSGDLSQTRIYLAGPPAMIHATMEAVLQHGANLDQIHSDDVPTLNHFRTLQQNQGAA